MKYSIRNIYILYPIKYHIKSLLKFFIILGNSIFKNKKLLISFKNLRYICFRIFTNNFVYYKKIIVYYKKK